MKKIEQITNVAILFFVCLFTALVVRGVWFRPAIPKAQSTVTNKTLVGHHLNLPGSHFERSKQTLVVAAATYCHFCIDSIPFYKKLSGMRSEGRISTPVIFAFPQSQQEVVPFLADNQLHPDVVLESSLTSLGVEGTPTLLLVDGQGNVTKEWIGKVDQPAENDILHLL